MKTLLKKRTHWSESITDLRIRPNLKGLTSQEVKIAKKIYDFIPQYRCASRVLATGSIYTRTSPQGGGYRDMEANRGSAYIFEKGELVTICHNINITRLRVATEAYKDWKNGKIDTSIWENYITNGYTTRIGLYRANKIESRKNKAKRMGQSHADYTGSETGKSVDDHYARVELRRV